jgi:hypothetical protein
MGQAEEHRRRAMRFLQLADSITDPVKKAKALDLAVKWAARAQHASEPRQPSTQRQQVQPENVDC